MDPLSDISQTRPPVRAKSAEARRRKAALDCVAALERAARSLSDFLEACRDMDDGSTCRGDDDGRLILMRSLLEYASWLDGKYGRDER